MINCAYWYKFFYVLGLTPPVLCSPHKEQIEAWSLILVLTLFMLAFVNIKLIRGKFDAFDAIVLIMVAVMLFFGAISLLGVV